MSMNVMNDENIQWCITQIKSGNYNLRTLIKSAGYPYSHIEEKEIAIVGVEKRGRDLAHVCADLRDNYEVVLAAVQNDGTALEYASARLKGNKNIVLAAVTQNGEALKFAAPLLTKDREIVLAAVENCTGALLYASPTLKNDKEIILTTLKNFKNKKVIEILDFIGDKLWKDEEVAVAALNVSKTAIRYINYKLLISNKNVALAAIRQGHWIWHELDKTLLRDKELLLAAIRYTYGDVTRDLIDDRLLNDIDIIKALVFMSAGWLRYASEDIKSNKELILYFINLHHYGVETIYMYTSPKLKEDKELMRKFVEEDHRLINELSPKLQADIGFMLELCEFAYTATSMDLRRELGKNLNFVYSALKINFDLTCSDIIRSLYSNNKEVIKHVVEINPRGLIYASDALQDDGEFVYELAHINIDVLRYASDRLKEYKPFMLKIVRLNGLALIYASEELQDDEEIVGAALNNNLAAYQYASRKMQKKFKKYFYTDDFGNTHFKYVEKVKRPSRIANFFKKIKSAGLYAEQNEYHNDTLGVLKVRIEMIPDPIVREELLRKLGVAKSYFSSNEARLCNDDFTETPDKEFADLIDFIKKEIDNYNNSYSNKEDNSKWF